uniref:Uncharacterized protein n=1 Tax=Ciona savignyi TaxID=51511 RepID=H2ZBF0_CIOSA
MEEINEGDLDLPLFDQLILDPRTHFNIEAEPLVLDSTNDFKLQATPTSKLLRFLHIGSEEDDLKVFNVARSIELPNVFETAAFELIKDGKGLEILSTLVNMVKGGHQYVEGAIPYVLAVCACSKVAKVKQEALNHVGTICNRPRMILEVYK